jgi:ribosome maturation factor RimP
MITASHIQKLIEEKIAETPLFIVDVTVSAASHIEIEIDSPTGVSVNDCLLVSRHIEASLDREQGDFSLEVASPGLDKSLRIVAQYLKNVGREVKVVSTDGTELIGLLSQADETGFDVTTEQKIKLEGKNKKELVTEVHRFAYDKVKTTHIIISFK